MVSSTVNHPIVVENKAGAAGILAVQSVTTAAPDGYSLLVGGTTTHSANPFLFKHLPYDPVRDLTPITMLGQGWQVLVVTPTLPVRTLAELIKYAAARPGALNYASGSSGSRIGSEAFLQKTGLKMTHVAFKGNPLAITEVMAGRTEMMVLDTGTAIPFIRNGKIRALGVTNTTRSPLLPAVPSISETVPGYDVSNYFGLWGPAGLAPDLTRRIATLFGDAARSDKAKEAFYATSGTAVRTSTPQELAEYQRREARMYSSIIQAAGIVPD
ncbi:tripartite tricarboxylate transporter substrate binding protein [Cupriavidus necator]|uniref:Bug family tripartite tricarboxylate transporter substrate binding protein n=1 Tax=Cupriavidus necator TaxID=106590 RepID=UPI0013E09F35